MIEKILYDYLADDLELPVYMEKPSQAPSSYILIEKTGSSKRDKIETAVIAVQSYAPTLYEAAALNETIKDAVENAVELPEIGSVRLNSDYNFSNIARKEYRYQAVFEITYY